MMLQTRLEAMTSNWRAISIVYAKRATVSAQLDTHRVVKTPNTREELMDLVHSRIKWRSSARSAQGMLIVDDRIRRNRCCVLYMVLELCKIYFIGLRSDWMGLSRLSKNALICSPWRGFCFLHIFCISVTMIPCFVISIDLYVLCRSHCPYSLKDTLLTKIIC